MLENYKYLRLDDILIYQIGKSRYPKVEITNLLLSRDNSGRLLIAAYDEACYRSIYLPPIPHIFELLLSKGYNKKVLLSDMVESGNKNVVNYLLKSKNVKDLDLKDLDFLLSRAEEKVKKTKDELTRVEKEYQKKKNPMVSK
jgi:hypothetical protein